MKIGTVEIIGKVALAPMAGATDAAYRQICMGYGAAYAVSVEYGDRRTAALCDLSQDKRPVFLQLFGDSPETFAIAAKRLLAYGPDGFDINMGCPVPKIAGNGAGSALLREPEKCGAIVAAVKDAVDVPVTVKLRAGWDPQHVNAVEVAKICEAAGADAVCIHGRTRDQMYQGRADWAVIRQVKEAVGIPVIGNGDVTGAMEAALMLDQTGCDLVMVGRAALGNPWVFQQINTYLTNDCRILPGPGIAERVLTIRQHIGLLCAYKGEERGMREARKHVGWYARGLRGAADFRRRAGELCTLDDLDRLLKDMYAANCAASQEE